MRGVAIIAGCLLWAIASVANSVEVTEPLQSSRHVRITVLLNGRPAPGAKVDFCIVGKPPCISVLAGDDGVATPPRLREADYTVSAALDDDLKAYLYLRVSRKGPTKSFPIDLTEQFRAAQRLLGTAEQMPVLERLQEFQGFVRDPSGSMVAGAAIKILRKGSEDHKVFQMTKSDPTGHFSLQLAEGTYIAFFSSPGFRTAIVPFEVTEQGTKELRVILQVGEVS